MKSIVQKFGGTSVATDEGRKCVTEHVIRAREEGYACAVVVSAMGRSGDPYATDTLIGLARKEFPEVSDRDLDLLISCGEIIAAVVVASTLRKHGLETMVFSGAQAGIITDGQFRDARIVRVEPARLMDSLSSGRVAVVAGFQGVSEAGEVTTLGRGGSDTTAAALSVGLRSELLEIYSDVDGVKTADPRIVPDARTIDRIGYDEIVQLAYEGARVVHPRAVEIARRNAMPIRVRNTFADGDGTLVCHPTQAAVWPAHRDDRIVTGVTHLTGLSQVTVNMSRANESELELKMFGKLADAGVSVDMINVSVGKKVFCVVEDDEQAARKVFDELWIEADICSNCAKISIVGAAMRGMPGVMARVVRALNNAGVSILQTSDSHVTISCLVAGDQISDAARALHREFGLSDS